MRNLLFTLPVARVMAAGRLSHLLSKTRLELSAKRKSILQDSLSRLLPSLNDEEFIFVLDLLVGGDLLGSFFRTEYPRLAVGHLVFDRTLTRKFESV
jgi:hypothetical protein